MNFSEEIKCYYCNKIFYLHSFKLREAKSVSCYFCKKRVYKDKVKK